MLIFIEDADEDKKAPRERKPRVGRINAERKRKDWASSEAKERAEETEVRAQTTESRRGPARENAVRTRVGLGARPSSSVQDKT